MNDYYYGLEEESSGNSLLDWVNAGVDVYRAVNPPETPAVTQPKPAPAPVANGQASPTPWKLIAAGVAFLVALALVLRRN